MRLTEALQVAGGLLVFRALFVEIAHALVGFGAEVMAALCNEGVEVDLRVLLLPEAAELIEVGDLFDNVLADLFLAVKRPLPYPALDLAINLIGQRLIGARLVPLASSLTFRSDPVGGEPSVSVEADVFSFRPVEALNVFPLGARGGLLHC